MTYVIADWQSKFETAETRKLEHLKWSPAPNKLDGLGYRIMVQERDRCELFAAWNVMRAVASKTTPKENRGRLERDGRPLSALHLAVMSGFPAAIFERAFTFFSGPDIQWLISEEDRAASATPADSASNPGASPARPADAPASPGLSPAVEKVEKEGREKKDKGRARALVEVLEFCREIGLPKTDAEWFWHKCEANGWMNGSRKILDWQATLRSWKAGGFVPSIKNPRKGATPPAEPKKEPKPQPAGWLEWLTANYPKANEKDYWRVPESVRAEYRETGSRGIDGQAGAGSR